MPMMRRRFLGALAPGMAAILLGCDSAPQDPLLGVAGVPAGKGRLYIYRENKFYDALVWTAVSLNGTVVGSSAPGSVFYRDVAPGTYRIAARSDQRYPDQAKTVVVTPGMTVFVRIAVAPAYGKSDLQWLGNTFVVQIVDPAVARLQMSRLELTRG
jgi:Protein of unknown function (DUF2846)